mgnify:CR=1 FL=1
MIAQGRRVIPGGIHQLQDSIRRADGAIDGVLNMIPRVHQKNIL